MPMSRLAGRVAPVMLVLALVLVGLPIGMPMASCPQCVLTARRGPLPASNVDQLADCNRESFLPRTLPAIEAR